MKKHCVLESIMNLSLTLLVTINKLLCICLLQQGVTGEIKKEGYVLHQV